MAMLFSWSLYGQVNHGIYFHRSFSPKEYKLKDYSTSPQNWGIAQDHRGLMYFCNSSGILEYDGIRWSLVPGTEYLDMFKAICGADGKIYTGGTNEFGYLGQGDGFSIEYISLTHLLPDSITDFGNVLMVKSFADSIVFLSPHHLFIYHNGQVSVYPSKDRYRRLHSFHGRMIVQFADAGLCEFNGKNFVPLHQNEMPEERIVRHMLGPVSGPILACNNNGFLHINNNIIQYQASVLDTLTLWNGDALHEIHAIGSTEKGALIIDNQAQLMEVFHTAYDLTGHSVVTPFFDRNSQLWLATSNGIRHIEYPGQLSYFDEQSGLQGIPLCIDESGTDVLVGTTQGLFRKNTITQQFEKVVLERHDLADEFVTDIVNLQDDKLILTSHGLFKEIGESFDRITNIGGFDLEIVGTDSQKLVYGGEHGIVRLSKVGGRWQVDQTISNISHVIMSVTGQTDQTLWASMFSISKIDFDGEEARVTELDSTHQFDPEMGPVSSFMYQGKVYFCTSIGLYSWDETQQRLEPDNLFGQEFGAGAMGNPVVMGDTAIWLSHDKGVGPFDLRTKEFLNQDLRRIDYSDVWRIQPTDDGHFWILTTEAVVRYDPSIENTYQEGFNTLIRGVTTREDSVLFDGFFNSTEGAPSLHQPDSMKPVLAYRYNQLSIKYAATYYNATDEIVFSTFLEGQDEQWSQWSNQPFKDYMNLKEGDYIFHVKARNVYGVEGTEATYSFSVNPPWYRSNWAYLFYLICILLSVWGIAVLYSLRLRRQKKELEGIVKLRTKEIAEEKQKSDRLLLNILPEKTATELKNQGYATTRSYDRVSVLFTDFVSFTSVSETMTPEELVREINICFSAFDDIVEVEGVEKIKTIGDSYMCASGLNHDGSDPEIRLVRVGLAIRDFMAQHNTKRIREGLPHFEIRLGIHTGAVVAGVVGKKKFAYDIWGDTVNTASRMESNSEPGELNISAATYALVKDHFTFQYRGRIEAKNKGYLDMYFVKGMVDR